MTGADLTAIRKKLGLTRAEWGIALGYSPYSRSAEISVLRLERYPDKSVPGPVAMLAKIYVNNIDLLKINQPSIKTEY